jgi:hypothetical protein
LGADKGRELASKFTIEIESFQRQSPIQSQNIPSQAREIPIHGFEASHQKKGTEPKGHLANQPIRADSTRPMMTARRDRKKREVLILDVVG